MHKLLISVVILLCSCEALYSVKQGTMVQEQTEVSKKVIDPVVDIDEEMEDSNFFKQLRWFVIAGIALKTCSKALNAMKDEKGSIVQVTDSKIFEALNTCLYGAFFIWLADKMKYMDPVAD